MVSNAARTGSEISRWVTESAPRVTMTSWPMAATEMTPSRKWKLKVAPHLRPHELEATDLHPGSRGVRERVHHLLREGFRALAGLVEADQVLLGVAELLDHGLAELDLVEPAPHHVHGDGPVVAHLDQGASGEVDAVVEATPEEDGDQAQHHEAAGDEIEPAAPAHEVEIGVDEDLEHPGS